ncbi:MAG: hypothetical protein LC660_15960 [Desulfobacteraceae bacterium]|nr:hypothetical protein [Desulfobacteraceae bacterium]
MQVLRQILPHAADFKRFWKEKGPFVFALTSREFPPVLLEPEEWIFGHTAKEVLEELMQFNQKKMAFVRGAFNPKNQAILRPENLIPWKLSPFPEEWNHMTTDFFMPQGHLTQVVADQVKTASGRGDESLQVAAAFFGLLEKNLEAMGYILLQPDAGSRYAAIRKYLVEWEDDEADAGLI